MTKGIYVMYRGGSDAKALKKDRMYEVEYVNLDQEKYKLKDIPGWHDEGYFEQPASYFVRAKEMPKEGECLKNYLQWTRGIRADGRWEKFISSSPIKRVISVTDTMYQAVTEKNILIVQVEPLLTS